MRRVLAIGCCALWLGFGFLAGMAHIHHSDDHHDWLGELHLDHNHLAHAADHDHGQTPGIDTEEADHHGHNVAYLNESAVRVVQSSPVLTALIQAAPIVESPFSRAEISTPRPGKPREPPEKLLPPLRAPPV